MIYGHIQVKYGWSYDSKQGQQQIPALNPSGTHSWDAPAWRVSVKVADELATFESRLFFFHLIQKVNICSTNTALRLWPCSLNGCLFYYRRHWKSLQTSGSANCQKCYLKGSVQRGGHLPRSSQKTYMLNKKGLFLDFQTPRAVTVLMFGWLKV